MWCMILYSSVFLVYLCIYIHIYRGMLLLFGQNMHSAWPEEARRRLCMSRVTWEIRPPDEAEDAVLMVWASKEHFRKSVQASNTRMNTVRNDAERELAVLCSEHQCWMPGRPIEQVATLVINRKVHAHTSAQLQFPAETVIPPHLLEVCLVLRCRNVTHPVLPSELGHKLPQPLSSPCSCKTNYYYVTVPPKTCPPPLTAFFVAFCGKHLLCNGSGRSWEKLWADSCLPGFPR